MLQMYIQLKELFLKIK